MSTPLRAALACWLALTTCLCDVAQAQSAQPFFEARGKQRCEALNAWTDAIQARAPGIDLYNQQYDAVVNLVAQSFEDASFVPAFGKSFRALSDKDKQTIKKTLGDCYGSGNWYDVVATGFETIPGRMGLEWRTALEGLGRNPTPPAVAAAAPTAPAPDSAPADAGAVLPPYLVRRTGALPLQGFRLDPCPNLRRTDVYFAPAVYEAIAGVDDDDPRPLVAGELLDCSMTGTMLTAGDVQAVAAETFIRRAAGAGIAANEVVEAMHDGRLNPAWGDVELAWRGLVRMSGYALPPATIAAMQRDGRWNDGAPARESFERTVERLRPIAWQQRFGSYERLPQGDFLRELFAALASGASASSAAVAGYADVRRDGAYGQRMAGLIRESEAVRAAQEARAERLASLSEVERLSAALDEMFAPLDDVYDFIDAFEESMLDSGGALYAGTTARDKNVPSATLCNVTDGDMRIAAVVEWIKRKDTLDPFRKPEFQARGWSHLAPGQCGAIRVGSDNLAFVAIEKREGGRYVPLLLGSFGDAATPGIRDRFVADSITACGNPDGDFFFTTDKLAEIASCPAGLRPMVFLYLVQHANTAMTLDIGSDGR